MTATRFKVGDKVRVRKDLEVDCTYGGYLFSSFMETLVDEVGTVTGMYSNSDAYFLDHYYVCWSDEMLEPTEKTLYNLEKGDIVLFENNDDVARKVLAVIDSCYLLSYPTDFTSASTWYTVDDLKYYGYTVQQPKIETIKINGKEYNKNEVEEVIKELKTIDPSDIDS